MIIFKSDDNYLRGNIFQVSSNENKLLLQNETLAIFSISNPHFSYLALIALSSVTALSSTHTFCPRGQMFSKCSKACDPRCSREVIHLIVSIVHQSSLPRLTLMAVDNDTGQAKITLWCLLT